MAFFKISENTLLYSYLGVTLASPIVASLGTAYWGGHIVSSLAHEGLLRTGILATVQSVVGFIFGALLDEPMQQYISDKELSSCISMLTGSLVAGGIIYTIGFAAVKAGLISTALTLPAAAALVIIPAVAEGVCPFLFAKLVDFAKSTHILEEIKVAS